MEAGEAKLSTSHDTFMVAPMMTANSAPLIVDEDLNPPLYVCGSTLESDRIRVTGNGGTYNTNVPVVTAAKCVTPPGVRAIIDAVLSAHALNITQPDLH
jgi:hypothetical protein